ncbi:hypothetical protein [Sanguibacter gelidistatuariae]|nr:hypothetical protein [Sanguibacter gelidistatuariae]
MTVTGCSASDVCTAVGWNNVVSIDIDGTAGDVAAIELCEDSVCAVVAPVQQAVEAPTVVATLMPEDLATLAPTSAATDLPFFVAHVDERTWYVSTDMTTPDALTVRALSPAGDVLVAEEVALDWRRVGGSAQCGGPSEAGPITLDIP